MYLCLIHDPLETPILYPSAFPFPVKGKGKNKQGKKCSNGTYNYYISIILVDFTQSRNCIGLIAQQL